MPRAQVFPLIAIASRLAPTLDLYTQDPCRSEPARDSFPAGTTNSRFLNPS